VFGNSPKALTETLGLKDNLTWTETIELPVFVNVQRGLVSPGRGHAA